MACGLEEVVFGRVDMKELTLLEKVLVQILIQSTGDDVSHAYVFKVLLRAGLTKRQANEALDWEAAE